MVLSGSTRRPSRSLALGEAAAQVASQKLDVVVSSYDLIDAGRGLGATFTRDALSTEALAVIEAVDSADALIAVSPVYKRSYAGLFKPLFDFVSPEGFTNKHVGGGTTGVGCRHGLVVEHQLRPLFACRGRRELGGQGCEKRNGCIAR